MPNAQPRVGLVAPRRQCSIPTNGRPRPHACNGTHGPEARTGGSSSSRDLENVKEKTQTLPRLIVLEVWPRRSSAQLHSNAIGLFSVKCPNFANRCLTSKNWGDVVETDTLSLFIMIYVTL